jgi:hypothetical protein
MRAMITRRMNGLITYTDITTDHTAEVIGFIDLDEVMFGSETLAISNAIEECVADFEDGVDSKVDADRLAAYIMGIRSTANNKVLDKKQINDYTRHILREAEYCCRHAISGSEFYRIHKEQLCSDECDEINEYSAPIAKYGVCETCSLHLPAIRRCDFCE